eukprot:235118-Rhodomonas_salina.2
MLTDSMTGRGENTVGALVQRGSEEEEHGERVEEEVDPVEEVADACALEVLAVRQRQEAPHARLPRPQLSSGQDPSSASKVGSAGNLRRRTQHTDLHQHDLLQTPLQDVHLLRVPRLECIAHSFPVQMPARDRLDGNRTVVFEAPEV